MIPGQACLTACVACRYTFHSIVYHEFIDSDYGGATSCAVGTSGCLSHDNITGWRCDDGIPALACYGKTGSQVVTSMGQIFQVISVDDTTFADILYMFVFALTCKLFYAILVIRRTTRFVPLEIPHRDQAL